MAIHFSPGSKQSYWAMSKRKRASPASSLRFFRGSLLTKARTWLGFPNGKRTLPILHSLRQNTIGKLNHERIHSDAATPISETSGAWTTSFILLTWLAFSIAIPIFFLQPPTPVPADADAKIFSAERAAVILKHLVGDGIPHPAGSVQNDVVRERITSLFSEFGYETKIQKTSHRRGRKPRDTQDPELEVFPLENVMARLPGKSRGQAILLAAHYDSAPLGPGASDDGVGMSAVLEIARMLKSEGPFEHDIIFLITDGEEMGLLGADKFVELHPWANEIECAINLEARGTRGPSFMFETSEHSRWLIPAFAKSVRRPMTSSLFYEVYKILPNDTDFTIFKRAGMQGFNFAYLGNVNAYHTADDNFANVSLASLQHHGENMLGLTRTLADHDFADQPEGKVVYFDLLGWIVVYWPSSWSIAFSLIAIALVLVAGRSGFNETTTTSTSKVTLVSGGLIYLVVGIALMAGVGFLIRIALAFDGVFDHPWPDFPWPVPIAIYLVALTAGAAVAWLAVPHVHPKAAWTAVWILWGGLAVLVSCFVDGACHLFIIPVFAAGLSGVAFRKTQSLHWPAAIGAICCGFMWLPLEALFHDALGFTPLGSLLIVFRAIIVCTTILPLLIGSNRKCLSWIIAILGIAMIASLAAGLLDLPL